MDNPNDILEKRARILIYMDNPGQGLSELMDSRDLWIHHMDNPWVRIILDPDYPW